MELWLLINGTIMNSTTVPLLQAGKSYTLHYLWTPTVEGTYNVTAYAHPVPGESYLENNQMTKFVTVSVPPEVGVKAGDLIKYNYTVTGAPSGIPVPTWMKVETLSVEGPTVTVRLTMSWSNGTEGSETLTLDVARTETYDTGGTFETFFGYGFVIPANSTVGGDMILIVFHHHYQLRLPDGETLNCTLNMHGQQLKGETARTYAGASRTVVYMTDLISQDRGYESLKYYYWDKQTGVMVEASATLDGGRTSTGYTGMTVTAEAIETNMWEAAPHLLLSGCSGGSRQ